MWLKRSQNKRSENNRLKKHVYKVSLRYRDRIDSFPRKCRHRKKVESRRHRNDWTYTRNGPTTATKKRGVRAILRLTSAVSPVHIFLTWCQYSTIVVMIVCKLSLIPIEVIDSRACWLLIFACLAICSTRWRFATKRKNTMLFVFLCSSNAK